MQIAASHVVGPPRLVVIERFHPGEVALDQRIFPRRALIAQRRTGRVYGPAHQVSTLVTFHGLGVGGQVEISAFRALPLGDGECGAAGVANGLIEHLKSPFHVFRQEPF